MHEFVRCTDHPIRGRPSGGGPANAFPCGAESGSVMSKLKQEVSLSQDVPLPEQGTRFSMPGNSGDRRCRVQQRSPLLSDPLSDETRTCSCLISRGAFRGPPRQRAGPSLTMARQQLSTASGQPAWSGHRMATADRTTCGHVVAPAGVIGKRDDCLVHSTVGFAAHFFHIEVE